MNTSASEQTAPSSAQSNMPDDVSAQVEEFLATYFRSGCPELMEQWDEELRCSQARLLELDAMGQGHTPEACKVRDELSLNLSCLWRAAEAEPFLRQNLAIRELTLAPDHPELLRNLGSLGKTVRYHGSRKEAEDLFRRALAGWQRTCGIGDKQLLDSMSDLEHLLRDVGQLAEAESLCRQVVDARGLSDPETGCWLKELAELLELKGELTEAEFFYRRVVDARIRDLGLHDPTTAYCLGRLADLLKSKGDLDGAESFYRLELEAWEQCPGPDVLIASIAKSLAAFLRDRGKLADAERFAERAVQAYLAERGSGDDRTKEAEALLAEIRRQRAVQSASDRTDLASSPAIGA